jgi:hypothetical protein
MCLPVALQIVSLQVVKTTISPGHPQNMYLEQEQELARVFPMFLTPLEVYGSAGAFARYVGLALGLENKHYVCMYVCPNH